MAIHLCSHLKDEKTVGDKGQPRESVKKNSKSKCERMVSDWWLSKFVLL